MAVIDMIDERILSELQANGRLTMKALAETIGLSSPAMIERVKRLEERGILAGYRAQVNPHELGRSLTALISVELDRRHYDTFLNRLRSEPAVEECHRVTGDRAFLVKAHVASTEDLASLVDDLQNVGAKCSTSIVLSTPILDAAIVPPEGTVSERVRMRRKRRTQRPPVDPNAPKRKRGRPRKNPLPEEAEAAES